MTDYAVKAYRTGLENSRGQVKIWWLK